MQSTTGQRGITALWRSTVRVLMQKLIPEQSHGRATVARLGAPTAGSNPLLTGVSSPVEERCWRSPA